MLHGLGACSRKRFTFSCPDQTHEANGTVMSPPFVVCLSIRPDVGPYRKSSVVETGNFNLKAVVPKFNRSLPDLLRVTFDLEWHGGSLTHRPSEPTRSEPIGPRSADLRDLHSHAFRAISWLVPTVKIGDRRRATPVI